MAHASPDAEAVGEVPYAGALTFDRDGVGSNTYPAINVGAKIGYRLSPRVQLLLRPP